jgi:TP901 family phage tail tape measure protein
MNGQTLYVRFATNIGAFRGQLAQGSAAVAAFGARTDASMGRLEERANRNRQAIRGIGNAAGGVGLIAAAGLGVAIKKFAEFDKQMSSVAAATHAPKEELAALRAEAIKLGADTKFSATEAAQGIEELAKAGVSTADILGGGLKGALDLAAAGDLSVADSAEIAASALTQFGLSGKDIPHLADLLAAGAGKAQGSVTDLGAALNQSGLVAAGMGLSIEDTTGSLAAFASAGLTGSDAGTSFKTAIQRLQAPMGRGKKALDEYGISAYDAQGNFVGIANVAEQLKTKLSGLTQQQKDAALAQIFGSDAIRVGTIMYKNGAKGMQGWIDKTNDAGFAAETARLRTDNLAGDVERLGGSLDTLFIGIGGGADGPMRDLVQGLDSILSAAGALPPGILSTVAAALALTAAFGGVVFAATRMVGAVGSTRASLALLRTQASGAASSLIAMDRGMMLKNAAKGTAVLGGMAIASGAAGDAFGLSNTAAFALMGVMGGPLGVAAGAAVGAIMDVASANSKLWDSFNKAEESVSGATTFRAQIKGLKQLEKAQIHYSDISNFSLGAVKEGWKGILGDNSIQESSKRFEKAEKAVLKYQRGIQNLEDQTIGAGDGINEAFNPERMQQFADQVGPVLSKIGLDINEVIKAGPKGKNWGAAVAAIEEYRASTDTTAGRQKALQAALAGVDDELLTSAQSADTLAVALKGLFAPTMDQDAAIIAWRTSLRSLTAEMKKNGHELNGTSEAAGRNRTLVMGQVDALTKVLTASADAGEGADDLARRLDKGRQSIIDQGVAAGFSAEEMSGLLDKYGLTPEMVETIVKTTGAEQAKTDIDGVRISAKDLAAIRANPFIQVLGAGDAAIEFGLVAGQADQLDAKRARPAIKAAGTAAALQAFASVSMTSSSLNKMTANPGVRPKGIPAALMQFGLVASTGATVSAMNATPSVTLKAPGVISQLQGILGNLNLLDGKRVNTTVTTHKVTKNESAHGNVIVGGEVQRFARGGISTMPRIVRAGRPINQWAEPGTQGEAFIPYAQDRRKRATKILGLTAERFGYDLTPRGMSAPGYGAGGGTTTVVHEAPLVGALTVPAMPGQDAAPVVRELTYGLRRIQRGGKYNR